MTEDLSTILNDWQLYLQRANAVSAACSKELHALFEPWPVQTSPPKQNEQKTQNKEIYSPRVSAEEKMMLNQVNRGLKKASRAREKAVENLLPEIGTVTEDGDVIVKEQKTEDSQPCSISPAAVEKTIDGVAVVSESTLRDLVQKHMNQPMKEGRAKSNVQKKKAKIPSHNSDLIKGRASSSTRNGSSKKPAPETVLKIPKPVSHHRSSMYATSSSVIGKGLSSGKKYKKDRIGVISVQKNVYQQPLEKNARSLSATKVAGKSDSCRVDGKARLMPAAGHCGKGSATLDPLKARPYDTSTEISGCETGQLGGSPSGERNSARSSRLDKPESDLVSHGPNCETFGDAKLHSFDLLHDGENIDIPVSLKKHLASNWKWRHKILQHSKFKSSKATVFLENLAASSNKHPEIICSEMLKEYEYLLDLTESTYQKLEEEKEMRTSITENYEKCYKLYQEVLKKWIDIGERRQCLESGNVIPLKQSPADIIRYQSLRQLEKYTQLHLQVQLLEFQLDLQRALSDEFIPYLKTLDPGDERFSSIFRKVKGLLCFGGETFPSLVKYDDSDDEKDNIDDDDYNDDDGDDDDDDDSGNDAFHVSTPSSAAS